MCCFLQRTSENGNCDGVVPMLRKILEDVDEGRQYVDDEDASKIVLTTENENVRYSKVPKQYQSLETKHKPKFFLDQRPKIRVCFQWIHNTCMISFHFIL